MVTLDPAKVYFHYHSQGRIQKFQKGGGGGGGRKPNSRKGGGGGIRLFSAAFSHFLTNIPPKGGAVARPAPLLKLPTSRRLLQVRSKPHLEHAIQTNRVRSVNQTDLKR